MSLKGWMILSLGLNKYHTHRIRVWQPYPYKATLRKLPNKIKTIFNNLLPKLNSETYCIADILLFNHCNTIRSLLKSIIHSHILSFTFAVGCQKKSAAFQSCLEWQMETHVIWYKKKFKHTQKKGQTHTSIYYKNRKLHTHTLTNNTDSLLLFALECRSFTTCRVKRNIWSFKNKDNSFLAKNPLNRRSFILNHRTIELLK